MIIFIHPSPKILFPRNLYAGGISLAPENLDNRNFSSQEIV